MSYTKKTNVGPFTIYVLFIFKVHDFVFFVQLAIHPETYHTYTLHPCIHVYFFQNFLKSKFMNFEFFKIKGSMELGLQNALIVVNLFLKSGHVYYISMLYSLRS